jgi:hypothetical protein
MFANHSISTFGSYHGVTTAVSDPSSNNEDITSSAPLNIFNTSNNLCFPIDRGSQPLNTQEGHISRLLLALYCFYTNIHNNNIHKATTTATKQQQLLSKLAIYELPKQPTTSNMRYINENIALSDSPSPSPPPSPGPNSPDRDDVGNVLVDSPSPSPPPSPDPNSLDRDFSGLRNSPVCIPSRLLYSYANSFLASVPPAHASSEETFGCRAA